MAAVAVAALAIALTQLLDRDVRLAGTNSVRPDAFVADLRPGRPVCQTNVLVPKGAAGARVFVGTYGQPGPRLTVTVEDASPRIVRRGTVEGYGDGSFPNLRFDPISTTVRADQVCFQIESGRATLGGEPYPTADNFSRLLIGSERAHADIMLQLLREGDESLVSVASTAFDRASIFRPGWVGSWTYWSLVPLVLLLVAAAALILFRFRERPLRLRTAIAAVAAIAFLNGVVWSLVVPTFAPPDEVGHYAYVESIVEHGELPDPTPETTKSSYTRGTATAINAAAVGVIKGPFGKPAWTVEDERRLAAALDRLGPAAKEGGGGYTTIAAYSPLYYGLEAAPYALSPGDSLFTRMWLMRVLSALMAAATAAFAFLFARELAPSVAWLGPAAGLAVAFQPMFAFIGGAVNNDNLVFVVATLALYLLARALRRGLDSRLALAIGGAVGLAIVVKPTGWALVPVAVATLLWLFLRTESRRSAAKLGALAGAAFVLMLVLRYGLFPGGESVSAALDTETGVDKQFSLREFASYTWQWYLPPLPFMNDLFPGDRLPAYDVYLRGFWANFGALDTYFQDRVYDVLLALSVACVSLIAVAVYRSRRNLSTVLPRVALGVLFVGSLALSVNLRAYLALLGTGTAFAQGRYLLPAIAVFGAAVAGAGLAFGRRNGIVAATAAVVALGCFNAFCLGLVMTRFYT